MPKSRAGKIISELAFCGISLWIGLVGSISLFEQDVLIPADKLESQFHNLSNPNGESLKVLKYNKGL